MLKRLKLKEIVYGINEGYCRICGNKAKLTVDHIPPKKCGNNKRPVLIQNFYGEKLYSQNGVRFKTICSYCNNTRLGKYADSELVRVYKEFKSNYSNKIIIPNEFITITVNPKLISKSICGHLLAIMFGDNIIDELKVKPVITDYLKELKEFVLNDKPMLNVIIYYWFYCSEEIKIWQYFGQIPDIRKSKQVICGSIFKFMPFGLWVVNNKSSNCFPNLQMLPHDQDKYIMKFNIKKILNNDMPEMPGNYGITLFGDGIYNIKKKEMI